MSYMRIGLKFTSFSEYKIFGTCVTLVCVRFALQFHQVHKERFSFLFVFLFPLLLGLLLGYHAVQLSTSFVTHGANADEEN